MNRLKHEPGFTLVELLLAAAVFVLISVFAVSLIGSLGRVTTYQNDYQAVNRQLSGAVEDIKGAIAERNALHETSTGALATVSDTELAYYCLRTDGEAQLGRLFKYRILLVGPASGTVSGNPSACNEAGVRGAFPGADVKEVSLTSDSINVNSFAVEGSDLVDVVISGSYHDPARRLRDGKAPVVVAKGQISVKPTVILVDDDPSDGGDGNGGSGGGDGSGGQDGGGNTGGNGSGGGGGGDDGGNNNGGGGNDGDPPYAGGGSTGTVCTTNGQTLTLNASAPTTWPNPYHHRSTTKEDSSPITAHIIESNVIRFKTDELKGVTAGVSSFSLDDIAIIVDESVNIDDMLEIVQVKWYGFVLSEKRVIKVPSKAFIIYDGNSSNYSSGKVDDRMETEYVFGSKTFTIPGGGSTTVKKLHDNLGLPMVAHNKISLANLSAAGFWNPAKKEVAFKIAHVAHGRGHVNLVFRVGPCT